ncbi:MAG: hypothetical protein HY820_40625 [Acidobacteria bacterium]|nr:hypothetical protein [Acidobacteriota bacterium]
MFSTRLVLPVSILVFAGAAGSQPLVIGQMYPTGTALSSRCPGKDTRFSYSNTGDEMHGPTGIAIDPHGRLFVADYAGRRVLTWSNVDRLQACQTADAVIGEGRLAGPEAVAYDARTGAVFVADTLDHTVKGYRPSNGQRVGPNFGSWTHFVTLGTPGVFGRGSNQFYFPRGLAFDSAGRLFVADDFNKRIMIFSPPFANGQEASDSIGGYADGGFNGPKGLAMWGDTLFVADYYNNRVLRFTGPFITPDQVYASTGVFTGMNHPIDVAVHPDGSLLVTDQGNRRIVSFWGAVYGPSTGTPTVSDPSDINPEPLGIAVDRKGRTFLADYRAYRVVVRDTPVATFPISTGMGITTAASKLLQDLHSRPDKTSGRVAIGQQLITWQYTDRNDPNGWYNAWRKLELNGSPLPKIMGGELSDLMSYPGFSANEGAANELVRHGLAGHIVTLVWHPANPTNGYYSDPISTADLRNMVNPQTEIGRRWQTQLDRAGAALRRFYNAGVPVLFRPLHEQNGTFFWWGHNGSSGKALQERQAAWIAMWTHMVRELNTRQGLTNLLFVFGTNQVNYEGVAAPLTYYPGGAYADLVSIDAYENELNLAGNDRGYQHYSSLVGTGKPFGLSEFGQAFDESGTGPNAAAWDARVLVTRVTDSYPRTAFAVAWYSSLENGTRFLFALPDVSFGRDLLRNDLIQTQQVRSNKAE